MAEHGDEQAEPRSAFAGIQQNLVASHSGVVIQAGHIAGGVHIGRSNAPYRVEPLEYRSLSWSDPTAYGPSVLLSAERQVVPFMGRQEELEQLTNWRDESPRPLSAVLVHGAAGQGKTRLTIEFAARSARADWNVVVARHDKEMVPAANVPVTSRSGRMLVLVDDADQWPENDLEWLFADLQHRRGAPTRMMLTSRSSGWWPLHRLERLNIEMRDLPLEPLALSSAEREEAFVAAKAAFSAALGAVEPKEAPVPDLSHSVWSPVLAIHLAALAALNSEQESRPLPTEPSALSAYLLSVTQDFWQPTYANDRREGALIAAEESVQAQRQLVEAKPNLHLPSLAAALHNFSVHLSAHGRQHEAATAAAEAVAIYRTLSGDAPESYEPGEAAALNNLSLMLAEIGQHDEALEAAHNSVNLYRRLAGVEPLVYAPNLASALHNLANRLATVGRTEEALGFVAEAVDMLRALARADPDTFRPGLATALGNLGTRLNEVGRRDDALSASTEATALARELALANPTAYEPILASTLNNLGIRLAALGRHSEALSAIREAVEVRREIAKAAPGRALPDLASSLNNLGTALGEVSRYEEALEATGEAVELYRRLAEVNPAAWLQHLASALRGLAGVRAANSSTVGDALSPAEESARIYEELVRERPLAFRQELADAREIVDLVTGMRRRARR